VILVKVKAATIRSTSATLDAAHAIANAQDDDSAQRR
jgi:hypothetical protein